MARQALKGGDYISDGKRLLRIIELDDEGQLVEDCMTNATARETLELKGWLRIEPAEDPKEPADG